MKKSCLVAVITVLAAVAGALAAVAVYLHRREKELDEYERLLFGEDDAATVEPEAAAEEAAPAEVPAQDAPAGCVWASREALQAEYTLPGAFKAYRKLIG